MTTKINDIDLDALAAGEQTSAHAIEALQSHIAALEAHPNVPNEDVQAIKDGLAAIQAKVASDEAQISAHHADLQALHAALDAATPASIQVTPAQILAVLLAALGGAPGPVTTPANGGTTAPAPSAVTFTGAEVGTATDPNRGKYPLTMPQVAPGAVVDLGEGPDVLEFTLANNLGQAAPCTFSLSQVLPNSLSKGITGVLDVSSYAGILLAGDQIFRVRGVWGDNPHIVMSPAGNGNGTNGLWLNAATINGAPLGAYGALNSRVTGMSTWGAPNVMITANGAAITLMQPVDANTKAVYGTKVDGTGGTPADAAAPPVVSHNATASIITGATLNGTVLPPGTVASLLASLTSGSRLLFPAGRFTGSGNVAVPDATVEGAGGALETDPAKKTIFDCSGFRPYQDKACITISAANAYLKNFAVTGSQIDDALGGNGAGIRKAIDGIAHTEENIESYNNQDGELDAVGDVTQINCHFHHNGPLPTSSAWGYDHDNYVNGSPTTVHTIKGGLYEKPLGAHAVKSRAGTFKGSDGAVFEAGPDGSAIDFPNGGLMLLDTVTLRKLPGANDIKLVGFAMENTNNAATGMKMQWKDVLWDDPAGIAYLVSNKPGVTLELSGTCAFTSPAEPKVQGVSVTGSWAKKAG